MLTLRAYTEGDEGTQAQSYRDDQLGVKSCLILPALFVLSVTLSAAEERAIVFNHCRGMDPMSRRCGDGDGIIVNEQ